MPFLLPHLHAAEAYGIAAGYGSIAIFALMAAGFGKAPLVREA
ncbi:hypothetical protein [Methylobacterium gnaphalii]|uniref:Uncharacterized protein n=1 Tax=Methylobacterium gnaphalii TaxID=1010610 RepID=A0A512JP13_9HYPH|nr:hypothetical protein [Methylobacterium gnaphalii]GEP11690.1 hypothetical protein MGN01_35350 [Methylobacterium gnaphalii]GJD68795.1 hypothetical protein MMMDOFMJ_1719 [Methylobacterium gnaphalii]GLS50188.1 hypothetical protein GCM10007885_30400 [Methylobacterium gnaphalii]